MGSLGISFIVFKTVTDKQIDYTITSYNNYDITINRFFLEAELCERSGGFATSD